ncbi:MAG: hypothetical protein WBA53_00825 [Burkholderiaceae bacterium]
MLLALRSRRGTRCVRWRALRSDSRGEMEDEARKRADRKPALLGAFGGNKHRQPASKGPKKGQGTRLVLFNSCAGPATPSLPSKAASSGSLGAARLRAS